MKEETREEFFSIINNISTIIIHIDEKIDKNELNVLKKILKHSKVSNLSNKSIKIAEDYSNKEKTFHMFIKQLKRVSIKKNKEVLSQIIFHLILSDDKIDKEEKKILKILVEEYKGLDFNKLFCKNINLDKLLKDYF